MASRKRSPAIKKGAKVLVVGAGRIGCEVLKTLALSGCQDIHIIDMGLIKVADLNGHFLFRASDVGKSKASVAHYAVLKFRPHISITSYHANVEDSRFGVTVHVKRKTECYECQFRPAPETHHVYTITSTSSEVLRYGLFEAKGIVCDICPTVATTKSIIAGLVVIETVKVLQNDTKNYRMTCCSVHPKQKMLLMPVKPFEPNKSCYVCSETPLSLEINTKRAKLRDIVEKVVKNKLGMNPSRIRHGAAFLYEVGTGLNAAMKINYESNLDKVLSEFPTPVTSGTVLNIVDSHQGLSCEINIKHREEFDEEKEPNVMVLSGLTQATSVLMDGKKSNANSGSTSSDSELEEDKNNEGESAPRRKRIRSNDNSGSTSSDSELEEDKNNEVESAPRRKRIWSEVSGGDMSSDTGDTISHGKLEVDNEISNGKRSRLEDPEKEPHHLSAFPDDCTAAPSLSNKGFKSTKPKPPLVVGGEGCRICGDGQHHTVHCPLLDYLPPGTTVGPDYLVICGICETELPQPTPKWCAYCCERGGRAVEASDIEFIDEIWRHRHPELFYGPVSGDVCL